MSVLFKQADPDFAILPQLTKILLSFVDPKITKPVLFYSIIVDVSKSNGTLKHVENLWN